MRPPTNTIVLGTAIAVAAGASSAIAASIARAKKHSEPDNTEDPDIDGRLLDAAKNAAEERRKLREVSRLNLVAILVLFVGALIAAVQAVILVGIARFPDRGAMSQVDALRTLCDMARGLAAPEFASTSSLAIAALCVAIRSIPAEDSNGSRRVDILRNVRRSNLQAVMSALSMLALVLACIVWTGVDSRDSFGAAVITTIIAAGTVWLTATYPQLADNAALADKFARAHNQLMALDSWLEQLRHRNVPIDYAAIGGAQTLADRAPRIPFVSVGTRLLVVAAASMAYPLLLLGAGIVYAFTTGHRPEFSWALGQLLLILFYYAVASVYAVTYVTLLRWTGYTSKHPRRKLDISPPLLRSGYLLLAATLVVTSWFAFGYALSLGSIGYLLLVPAAMWWALWRSRRRPGGKVQSLIAGPVWDLIGASLAVSRYSLRTRMQQIREDAAV